MLAQQGCHLSLSDVNEQGLAQTAALLQDSAAWQGRQPRRDDLTFFCFRP